MTLRRLEKWVAMLADRDRNKADLQRKLNLATDALLPFALFAERWDKNPIRGLDDALYSIHAGAGDEDIEGVLRLSDCKQARAALAGIEKK